MKGSKADLIAYRLSRAKETLEDAEILAEKGKWNSTINRLYYSAYYGVMALLLYAEQHPTTHTGAKSSFSNHFIKTGIIPIEYGKMYSQLFTWRQKGDYDDLFDFKEENVRPYLLPVRSFLDLIEKEIQSNP